MTELDRHHHASGVFNTEVDAVVVAAVRIDFESTDRKIMRIGLVANTAAPVHVWKAGKATGGIGQLIRTIGCADEAAAVRGACKLPGRIDAAEQEVEMIVIERLFPGQLAELPLTLGIPVTLDLLGNTDIVRRDRMPVVTRERDMNLCAVDAGELEHVQVRTAYRATAVGLACALATFHAGQPVIGPDEAQRHTVVFPALDEIGIRLLSAGRCGRLYRVGRGILRDCKLGPPGDTKQEAGGAAAITHETFPVTVPLSKCGLGHDPRDVIVS